MGLWKVSVVVTCLSTLSVNSHDASHQRNILIDEVGVPRLRGFGWSFRCPTRNCAPEVEFSGGSATYESDMYSLSMIIVEVRVLWGVCYHWSQFFPFQLATGKLPFPEFASPYHVHSLVLQGERPSKPHRIEAPGFTPEVWRVAEMCWHEKPNKRPTVHTVLRYLEDIVNAGR